MNRSDANAAIACLSPAARTVWESDDLDDVDETVLVELQAAGLVELVPSWSDHSRDIQQALEPAPGVTELLDQIEGEGFADAIDCLEAWTEVYLSDFDIDAKAVAAVLAKAAADARAAYDNALSMIRALPSQETAEAA